VSNPIICKVMSHFAKILQKIKRYLQLINTEVFSRILITLKDKFDFELTIFRKQ
jgi:hypothetical protein